MIHPPQEPDVLPSRLIATVIVSVIVAIVIGVSTMKIIEGYRTRELDGDPRAGAEEMSGVPASVNALETEPFVLPAQGVAENERAERVLEGYSWVDRDHQILRVPITVAFDLYLARRPAPVAGREP
jgi:hypothetical protein